MPLFDYRILTILLTFVIPSFCTFIKAQQEGMIVIGNGAEIYSNDIHFNKNIISAERQELVLTSKGSVAFKYKFISSGSTKIRKDIPRSKSRNLRKRKNIIFSEKTIGKALPACPDLAIRKRTIIINAVPSPSQFVSSSKISKAYVVPGGNDISNFKASASAKSFSVTLCLDFLHCLNYQDYSSKSLSALFCKVYTVRPPPEI